MYSENFLGLSLNSQANSYWVELQLIKEEQTENISEALHNFSSKDIGVFTDGSSLTNPGPTGGSAVIYLDVWQ